MIIQTWTQELNPLTQYHQASNREMIIIYKVKK